MYSFNTQPHGGGCKRHSRVVSTHSRAEAAAFLTTASMSLGSKVSTLSRAEAAAPCVGVLIGINAVSTLSRAEAAAHDLSFSLSQE